MIVKKCSLPLPLLEEDPPLTWETTLQDVSNDVPLTEYLEVHNGPLVMRLPYVLPSKPFAAYSEMVNAKFFLAKNGYVSCLPILDNVLVKVTFFMSPLKRVLSEEPESFDNVLHYRKWLRKAYFISQIQCYFQAILSAAQVPQLKEIIAEELVAPLLPVYSFGGTHGIKDEVKFDLSLCKAKVNYFSNMSPEHNYFSKTYYEKVTTVNLHAFYALPKSEKVRIYWFIKQMIPVDCAKHCAFFLEPRSHNHTQRFKHEIIQRTHIGKKVYAINKISCFEAEKITYQEFPPRRDKDWPKAPFKTYSLVENKNSEVKKIQHLVCYDAAGKEANLPDNATYLILDEVNKGSFWESIIERNEEMYKVRYQYTDEKEDTEEIEKRFLQGKLVYRPNIGSDQGKFIIPICSLENPLWGGTFNLQKPFSDRFTISIGYEEEKEETKKTQIWIVPWFQRDKLPKNLETVVKKWPKSAQIGIFWRVPGFSGPTLYKYVTQSMDMIGTANLYEKLQQAIKGYDEKENTFFATPRFQSLWRCPDYQKKSLFEHFTLDFSL